LQAIADVCLKHDLLAITDEIYEHIVYDGLGHTRSPRCPHGRPHRDHLPASQVLLR